MDPDDYSYKKESLACFYEAENLLKQNELEGALANYDKAIQLDKSFPDPWHRKGNIFFHLKKYNAAQECYDKALQINPRFPYAWSGKGMLYYDLQKYEEALQYIEMAIQMDARFPEFWHRRGAILEKLKKYELAFESVDRAIKLDENFAYAWHQKGNILLFHFHQYEEAILCFNKAVSLDGTLAYSWDALGTAYTNLKQYEKALRYHQKALSIDPTLAKSWHGIGTIYTEYQEYAKAIQCYNKAITLDPADSFIWNGLGIVYRKIKDYEQALVCYEKALEINPHNELPWYNKGNVYLRLKELETALACYDKAIELNSLYPLSWSGKGTVYYYYKDYELALKNLLRCQFLGGDSSSDILIVLSRQAVVKAPLQAYRLLRDYITIENYYQWKLFVERTIQQCQHIIAYYEYLKLAEKNNILPNWRWQQFKAILHFHMGDPLACFEFAEEVLNRKKGDLRSYYYLILSCDHFLENDHKYFEQAIEFIEQLKVRNNPKDFRHRNISSPLEDTYQLEQIYYAGQILYLDEEPEQALAFFKSIQDFFLPATYMTFFLENDLKRETDLSSFNQLLKQEKIVWDTENTFANVPLKKELDFEKDDFWVPFYHYSYYKEIESSVLLFKEMAKNQSSASLPPLLILKVPSIWDTFTLNNSHYKYILDLGLKKSRQMLAEEILMSRAKALKQQQEQLNLNENAIEQKLVDLGSDLLWTKYEIFQQISNPSLLEQRLGTLLNDWSLKRVEHYRILTTLLLLENKIDQKQKILLDFYSVLKENAEKKVSDVLVAGLSAEYKALLSYGLEGFISIFNFTTGILGAFLKPLLLDTSAELLVQFLKNTKPKFNSYQHFKSSFLEFIGLERNRLGEKKFEQKYPMFGVSYLDM